MLQQPYSRSRCTSHRQGNFPAVATSAADRKRYCAVCSLHCLGSSKVLCKASTSVAGPVRRNSGRT